MRDHDDLPRLEPDQAATAPLDRTGQDGLAGSGDMLGGMSAGAGGRLGPDVEATNLPMPANQHSFADVTLPVDAAADDHDPREPA